MGIVHRRRHAQMNIPQARLLACTTSFLVCALITTPNGARAQGCSNSSPALNGNHWIDSNTKNVYIDPNLPAAMQASIRQAATDFAAQTGQPVSILPANASDPGASTTDSIRILNNPSGSPSSIAHTTPTVITSNFIPTNQQVSAQINFNTSAMVTLTDKKSLVPAYDPSQPNAAQFIYQATMHELGHAFGLEDAPEPPQGYEYQPAGASIMNGFFGTNDQGPHIDPTTGIEVPGGVGGKSVMPCDKQLINQANPIKSISNPPSTPTPPIPTPLPTCTTSMGANCSSCIPPSCDGISHWNPSICSCVYYSTNPSPIIIDTDESGFHLSSADDGVMFDFYGNGQPIQISWTERGSTNGWLALDRNGNGLIDNATELFGNITTQPTSDDPNGFLALALFDRPEYGGNQDGIIDKQDAIWPKLLVWIDSNHDGISQPNELHSLDEIGIGSISLKYIEDRYVDSQGNQFRYKGKLKPKRGDKINRSIYDVFLEQARTQSDNNEFNIAVKPLFINYKLVE